MTRGRRDDPRAHDVYWLYDSEGRILYIGCTVDIEGRLHQHRTGKEWWPRVSRVEVEGYSCRGEAREREADALRAERPMFNKRIPLPPALLPPIVRRDEPIHAVEEAS